MSSGSVCRVCLEGNVKLSPTKSIPLLNMYERITNTQFHKDERPQVFCPFCYQKLLKCYTFFTMAWRAENLFDQLVLQGVKEFVTKLKLGVTQQITKAPLQSVTINGTLKETIKEEPLDQVIKPEPVVKEEIVIVKSEAVCRVCLAGNLTLNPMDNVHLLDIYKKLTNIQFNSEDGRPRAVCPFCYQKLLKCYIFSKIACRSEKLFDQLLLNGLKEINAELVTKLTLRVTQPMAVTASESITIDPKSYYVPLMVPVKEEPVQEELTEENQTGNAGVLILEECIKRELIQQNPSNFFCTVCGKDYVFETGLKKHMRKHTKREKYVCKVCNKEMMHRHTLIKHMKIHSDYKEFACPVCNKRFRYLHHLNPHIRTHTGERPFPCTVCQRRFNEKTHLTRHMILHTGGRKEKERHFACNECNKTFHIKPNLIKHMLVHTGEKPFPCSLCDKRYQTKYNLNLHMNIHTKVVPAHACHLCDKRFHHSSHLRVHVRTHSKKTSDGESNTYQCSVCNEFCTLKKNLITHMRLLHPGQRLYACNDCDKQYDKKHNLIRHMSVHQGKQYSCDLCDTTFIHKINMIAHMRIHTGETPFACALCKEKYTQKYMLNEHIKKKHKVKSKSESDSE